MELVGETVGQYQIIEELGKGGMATVYKAYQPNLQRFVAIKVLAQHLASELELVKRFLREARAAAALNHPNVIGIYDVGSQDEIHYIVAEYLEGMTLGKLLEQTGPFSQERVLHITSQIASALDYAHSKGLIHRDIKPSNIMVDPARNDHVTLMDFGLVQVSGGSKLTRTGFIMGTPDYMSPEQAKGDPIDHRTDVYSLGVTVYHMLAGKVPFEKPTPHAVLMAHIMEEPPVLALPEGTAPAIDAVVRRSMAKEANMRYEWAGNLVDELESAMQTPESFALPPLTGADFPTVVSAPGPPAFPPFGEATKPAAYPQQSPAYSQTPEGGVTPYPQQQPVHSQTPAGGVTPYPQQQPVHSQTPAGGVTPYPQQQPVYNQTPAGGTQPPQMPTSEGTQPSGKAKWIWPAIAIVAILMLVALTVSGALIVPRLLRETRATDKPASTNTVAVLTAATATPTRQPSPTALPTSTPTATSEPTSTPVPPTPTPVPTLGVGSIRPADKDEMAMVYVPEGPFSMGSTSEDANAQMDEQPQHTVYLDAFWIDQTEVSNAMFARFVEDTNHTTDAERQGWGWVLMDTQWTEVSGADWQHPQGPDNSIDGLEDHPVVQISWHDADAYCRWAGRQLPSEAQWEKAARGTQVLIYPWGNAFDGRQLNYCDANCNISWRDASTDDGFALSAPVGSYPSGASPYGALDMIGNVWEWVSDWYDQTYYANSPSQNPTGPASGQERGLRGGGWSDEALYLRSADRSPFPPDQPFDTSGFRCALPATQ